MSVQSVSVVSTIKKDAVVAFAAVIAVTLLRSIPIYFTVPNATGWVVPLALALIIPVVWMRSRGLSLSSLGLASVGLNRTDWLMGIVPGALVGSLSIINHQVVQGLPIVITPAVLAVGAFFVVVQAPLTEFFWRGFVQKRLEDVFVERSFAIPATTLLAIIAEIPLFIGAGKTPTTVLFPLAVNLSLNLLYGLVFYKRGKLKIAVIAHSVQRLAWVLAHSSEIASGVWWG